MLLFICIGLNINTRIWSFNTSHVVIYQYSYKVVANIKTVSIHLMLLFIEYPCICSGFEHMFQYISCCYLSAFQSVYPAFATAFQYISCCYLSDKVTAKAIKKIEFQYISCCYLSLSAKHFKEPDEVSIHLMLLFIKINIWYSELSV